MVTRKKKLETTESVSESSDVAAEEAVIESEVIESENIHKSEVKKKKEETSTEEAEEDKDKKKKEKKKLSEVELKRVMTDTKETLIPLTEYIACGVHLGTKVITPDMRKFVYKRRADGLAVLNTNLIDDKIREAIKFLVQFAPEDIFIAGKREAGWPAIEKFSEVTGIRCFMKKYPAGIITNLRLETFFEPKLALICDPWVDKNALNDSNIVGIPVVGICDTNNYAKGVTQVIVGNNKSRKSIGCLLYILAREYLKALGKTKEAKALKMEDFAGKIEVVDNSALKEERKSSKKALEANAEKLSISIGEEVKEGV
ncbi:MAG: 30S ribosomal protein S2 [archaeon]|nr:30S ribosomal protein S2 [archaeon]